LYRGGNRVRKFFPSEQKALEFIGGENAKTSNWAILKAASAEILQVAGFRSSEIQRLAWENLLPMRSRQRHYLMRSHR
jgi:hypothetical protein